MDSVETMGSIIVIMKAFAILSLTISHFENVI